MAQVKFFFMGLSSFAGGGGGGGGESGVGEAERSSC